MKDADPKSQTELFYDLVDEIEKEYYLYFGLKTIQKGLDKDERIYDHFTLNERDHQLQFLAASDLPDEIRSMLICAHQKVFLSVKICY